MRVGTNKETRNPPRPRGILLAATLVGLAVTSRVDAEVRVYESSLDLPTDEEGPPDPNPPFDLFRFTRYSYPYPLRESLTGRQSVVRHRALVLENEHLRCTVLPDLGGHLYGCTDKANGAELFYANRSLRKARIGYRGAWVAFGIEFNYPVSHNWVSLSPVDFAARTNEDGSGSIWVGNTDRVYGMRWRVELRLRPGSSLLEQHVVLENPSPARRRFYWWNNAAVRVRDDSRIFYPMRFTASHGFREVDTWPVNADGVDLSRVGNHLYGPVSLFAHGSREGFMGVHHPWNRTGVIHYSSPEDAPTKKIWSWGSDADGLDWRKALSDDDSAYVEVQAGLFRNQETYGLLGPQGLIRFAEYWMPVRGIGGITRANPDAVLSLTREGEANGRVDVIVGVNVNRAVQGGRLRLLAGDELISEEAFDLDPRSSIERRFPALAVAPSYTVTLLGEGGVSVISHTEGVLDVRPAAEIQTGPQPFRRYPPAASRSEGDFLALGEEQEREGKRLQAFATYGEGLERFPDGLDLRKARGRMAVDLQRFAEAVPLLDRARARSSADPEVLYSLGLALAATGRESHARTAWESASHFPSFRAAARLELSRLDAREGRREEALARVREIVTEFPPLVSAGALEVVLSRTLGRSDEARSRALHWLRLDPAHSLLRHESVLLGRADAGLLPHLAADPDRVLALAGEYMSLGLWSDALRLLDRRYEPVPASTTEPGGVLPQDHPLVAYYRGYCREGTGSSPTADFSAASGLETRYVFPSRADSFPVLRRALEANPGDATARFLLGSLHLAGGDTSAAAKEWQEARRENRAIPVLHRNLGMALLHGKGDARAALDVFREGMDVDAANPDLYQGADQAASLEGLSTTERIALLRRFPDPKALPPALVQKLALALVVVGKGDEAEALFPGRFFPREEGGTNVRQVYLEVRLRRALALARGGRAKEAAAAVASLERPVKGLAFTGDGLADFLNTARLRLLKGDVLAAAGRAEEARQEWGKAKDGHDGSFLKPVHVALAERRLGSADPAAQHLRLEQALASAEVALEQGTGFPGIVLYAQGLTLRALGREEEAALRFRRVFFLPDVRLSHFLAGRALEGRDPL